MNNTAMPTSPPVTHHPAGRLARRRRWWWLCVAALAITAFGIWMIVFEGRSISGKSSNEHAVQTAANPGGATTVELAPIRQGGIDRVCVQPGTVEPFESADLYSKVSGFLIDTVDIGKKVKKGEVLARLSVPEYEKQVKKDAAAVAHMIAKQRQTEAHLLAAKADARAAEQLIVQAKVEMKSKAAYRAFRGKQLERIKALYKDQAVEAKLVDEVTDQYEASLEAENAAREAITTNEQKAEAAKAKVDQAAADIEEAKAEIDVAKAELERAKVLLDYTVITSPYDGVVTKRNFFPGDFIRSADAGGDRSPVVAVDRTDLMRIVVQVPDADVPYVDRGDTATIEIDALPGKFVKGVIARSAESEDAQTRTMRTEIDIPNTDGRLRRNMYGRVRLTLQKGTPTAVQIPLSAIVHQGDAKQPFVRVVRDGRVHLTPVEIGLDTGVEVEILRGLQPSDQLILRANGPMEEGAQVIVKQAGSISAIAH